MRSIQFIVFLVVIGSISPIVQFSKKRLHDEIQFSRVLKYTNETLSGMKVLQNMNLNEIMSLEVLFVADYSTYQAFLEMTNGDVGGAQHYINTYLTAIFEQIKIIYDDIKFGDKSLNIKLAGTFTAYREEDCPLWLNIDEEVLKEEHNTDDASIEINNDNITLSDIQDTNNSTEFYNEAGNMTEPLKISKNLPFETMDEILESNTTEMSLRIDSKEAIDKFTSWIKLHKEFLPQHEHAVLITKFDLLGMNGHSSTQGMAYAGNICQLGDSSSVVEDVGSSLTALIAAHEIGHSLGAVHDGSFGAEECDSNDNYLLAAAVSGSSHRETFLNSRKMSKCSINSIINNLKTHTAQCIRKWIAGKKDEPSKIISKKPGETISLMQQCQIAFGPTFGHCLNTGYYHNKSVCERVWCSDRKAESNDQCQTLNYFPAFDGTECGYNMWCINGECVRNSNKWLECQDLNAKTCSKYSAAKLKHFCKSRGFRDICCRTCAQKVKKRIQ